jgi:ribosomal protein S17
LASVIVGGVLTRVEADDLLGRHIKRELDVHLHAPCSARGSADLILIPPCRHAAATHFDFLVRPMGGLYERFETLQGGMG